MKLTELYTHKFNKPVTVTNIDDIKGITFSDGTLIYDEHDQECCEEVYADWKQLIDTTFNKETFKELKIKGHDGFGIIINEFAIPCYDIQNGYYNHDLKVIIQLPLSPTKIVIDIANSTSSEKN